MIDINRASQIRLLTGASVAIVAAFLSAPSVRVDAAAAQPAGRGMIKGHVKLSGKLPGNPIIRMGMDPMCARINTGKRVIQETVVANLNGDLANVFVKLLGSFPQAAPPSTPVVIDQRACVYTPRVVGVQVGQTLEVKNDDPLLHNVHGMSGIKENGFNVGQPLAGIKSDFKLKEEERPVRLKCDVHSWMTAWIGVVSHPYFAVSNPMGTFEIANVPPGTYEIQAWHERYGPIKQSVRVRAGATTMVNFMYTGEEKPPS